MNFKVRKALVVIIWILSFFVLMYGLVLFAFEHSEESNKQAVRNVLQEMKTDMVYIMADDGAVRLDYDKKNLAKGKAVRILQDYGLEENVPDDKNLKQYMEMIGATYIAVIDSDGKTVAEQGDKYSGDVSMIKKSDAIDLEETFDLVADPPDRKGFKIKLKGGYSLYYEVDYTVCNNLANETFSWRSMLQSVTLPDNASFMVISKYDGSVLVHPNDEKVGKNISDFGIRTVYDLEKMFSNEDEQGIRWTENDNPLFENDDKLLGQAMNSAITENELVYIICSVTSESLLMYILQTIKTLPAFYGIGSFLALLYILFYLSDRQRKEKETGEDYLSGSDYKKVSFGMFQIDRDWAKRLGVASVIILIVVTMITMQFQLLSNISRIDADNVNKKNLVKQAKERNRDIKDSLDIWYRKRGSDSAKLATYIISRDESLLTRPAFKRIAKDLLLSGLYRFRKDGTVQVTSTTYDHLDLKKDKKSTMSVTFLPLLEGEPLATWTPLIFEEEPEQDSMTAYAGVSVRNSQDLCDGCVVIVKLLPYQLVSEDGTFNMYNDIIRLNSKAVGDYSLITVPQLRSTGYLMFVLAMTLLLMYVAGTLTRKQAPAAADTEASDSDDGNNSDSEHAQEDTGKSEPDTAEEDSWYKRGLDFEEWFVNITDHDKDKSFHKRWNIDTTKVSRRSPEKKLMMVINAMLFIASIVIIAMFFTHGLFGINSSIINNLFSGGWERGFNLYAFTAAELTIILAVVGAMVLHRLIFIIASFCTQRGETICILLSSLVTYGMIFLAGFYVLHMFGINPKTLLVSAGVLGIIVGFGANTMIADILAGIFLIFEDVIHVGDCVQVGDNYGIVTSIGVRMTKIQFFSDIISINNSEMKGIKNLSGGDARAECTVPVDNMEDLDRIEEILKRELPVLTEKLAENGVECLSDVKYGRIDGVDEHGYKMKFNVMCPSYNSHRATRVLNAEIIKMCQRNNIRIARDHVSIDQSEKDDQN